jgi:ABC-type amino acid transport substrate-binding protein
MNGEAEALLGAAGFSYRHAQPPQLIKHKIPIAPMNIVYVGRKNFQWKYTGPDSAKDIRFGFVAGYEQYLLGPLGDYLIKNRNNKMAVELAYGVDGGSTNIRKLLMNRIDVAVDEESVIKYHVYTDHVAPGRLHILGSLSDPLHYFIGFNPRFADAKKCADLIDEKLRTMKKNGEYKKLIESYEFTQMKIGGIMQKKP